jgi:hypothetical protein
LQTLRVLPNKIPKKQQVSSSDDSVIAASLTVSHNTANRLHFGMEELTLVSGNKKSVISEMRR